MGKVTGWVVLVNPDRKSVMSLFRTAAVIAVGVALLPSEPEQQARFYERATAAAHWTFTFCDRNADTCETAGDAWDKLLSKAGFGLQVATDLAQTNYAPETEPEVAKTPPKRRILETGSTKGTLTANDRRPAWRGQEKRSVR